MKFRIGKHIKAPFKDTYVIDITTMEGDADDSHQVLIKIKKEMDLAELVTELKKLGYMPFNGADSRSKLSKISPILFKYVSEDEWPIESNSGFPDDIDRFEVFYYNDKHEKFEVIVEEDKPAPRFGEK